MSRYRDIPFLDRQCAVSIRRPCRHHLTFALQHTRVLDFETLSAENHRQLNHIAHSTGPAEAMTERAEAKIPLPSFLKMLTNNNIAPSKAMAVAGKMSV